MKKLPFILLFTSFHLFAQEIEHIDPPFWWTEMPTEELQIMLHGEEIGDLEPSLEYAGVSLESIEKLPNRNYLVLNLKIAKQTKPGTFKIALKNGKSTQLAIDYELKSRTLDSNRNMGFDASDVIYLLMPDRFANGDPSNDTIEGMFEAADRSNPNGRHGGDIKGVLDNLDYIKDLGMTAVWLTPTFENDMKPSYGAYHGYAATDLYKVDRRFGSNEEFKAFVEKCHGMDMKVIMDMIHNHVGDQHWWMKDLPSDDWFHDIEEYGTTNFRGEVQSDPYASQYDLDKLQKGWFVAEMPDLNQRNPILAKYLIQNSIWWIEYSGVDGIRMDTYVYPYKDYLADWVSEVMTSYPNFNIVGEAWVEKVGHEAYWQEDMEGQDDGYDSQLPSVTDFQIMFALDQALTEDFGWKNGLSKLYYAISQDRLYSDPMKNVVFIDNHDTERFFTKMGEDPDLFKMGYAYLMTIRGIPQVYYGIELMLANDPVSGDGRKRADMIGGWPEDKRSVFTREGRTKKENEAFDYVKKLTNWRKGAEAIHKGKLTHFIPENNTYVYFRHTEDEAVMVVMNQNEKEVEMNRDRFAEILNDYKKGLNVGDGSTIDVTTNFKVGPKQTAIFELKK
ncbi:Glycosidase [Ekhidna lutea]|uniref:Glycosidase n=1 Tax=Ekhidna lutea TaxID=447679 RepID=A0A239LVV6_EKHLU|nr:glycoside hydrolase family 13 protein [Ekhidna lutea]SNT34505.1 Glycosidase [Ekhidna lutea]